MIELIPVDERRPSALSDVWVVTRRGLLHMRREPDLLLDATIQPVMFVLLFAYVFGGAIAVPGGGSYREFLIGGIFAQTIVFGGTFGVAMAIATDRTNGAMDRFRSLPMARGAVLSGHALANLIKTLLPLAIFPITFVASTFVPTSTLPGVLKTFAQWNPVSSLSGSLRTLFGNPGGVAPKGSPWSLQHPVAYTLMACALVIGVCAPLAIRSFQRSITD
jgi:ABC-2 type transport system permease protein